MEREKIGLMGGTFDPVHVGHLLTAEAVREKFGLSRILFIPAARPPHKEGHGFASAEARLAMTRLATADNPAFMVSDIELKRTGPSYSLLTVEALMAHFEGKAELYFITGADALNELGTWYHAPRLLSICHFIAATRQGSALDRARLVRDFGEELVASRIHELATPELELSSTDIRARVGEGRSIRYRVPAAVADYIYKEGLYK